MILCVVRLEQTQIKIIHRCTFMQGVAAISWTVSMSRYGKKTLKIDCCHTSKYFDTRADVDRYSLIQNIYSGLGKRGTS